MGFVVMMMMHGMIGLEWGGEKLPCICICIVLRVYGIYLMYSTNAASRNEMK